jgi:CRP-like cAMP-binding protein
MDETRLKQIPLFAELSQRELEAIARHADEVDVPAGKHLVNEGSFAYEFFVIEDGKAEVVRGDERIAELGPGDFFGEMGLIDHTLRSASVVATEPLTAIVMSERDFHEMQRELPGVAERLVSACRERTAALSGDA